MRVNEVDAEVISDIEDFLSESMDDFNYSLAEIVGLLEIAKIRFVEKHVEVRNDRYSSE